MWEIIAAIGWFPMGILLLYLWSDVREIKRELKAYRRDSLRNSVGGRTSDHYPGFSEETYWKEAGQETVDTKEQEEEPALQRSRTLTLKPGEEQVLKEILLEFLG